MRSEDKDIKVSMLVAERADDNSIINITDKLESGGEQGWCVYLIVKANLEENTEIKLGIDLLMLEKGWGIELGEIIIGTTNDDEKLKEIKNEANGYTIARPIKNVMYKNTFNVVQEFSPLPKLDKGRYELIVYWKKYDRNMILDTYSIDIE